MDKNELKIAFGKKLKEYRLAVKVSQDELAKACGYESRSTINKIELGKNDMPRSKILLAAKKLGISPADLFIVDTPAEPNTRQAIRIPVLGDVAAGIPIEAVEDIIDYEEIPAELAEQGQFFGLRIKGDSMEPRICEGDVVIVKKQEDADTGDIVIACVNGDSATCKRLIKYPDQIVLMPLNNKYDPIIFTMEDVKNTPLTIIGKVVELRGKL